MAEKITKIMWYDMLAEVVAESDAEKKNGMLAFIAEQKKQLEDKSVKAKERAAQNKKEDPLLGVVQNLLTDDYQTTADIADQIEDAEVTKAKVSARLTKLFKEGLAEKASVKTEEGKKVMAYKKAGVA